MLSAARRHGISTALDRHGPTINEVSREVWTIVSSSTTSRWAYLRGMGVTKAVFFSSVCRCTCCVKTKSLQQAGGGEFACSGARSLRSRAMAQRFMAILFVLRGGRTHKHVAKTLSKFTCLAFSMRFGGIRQQNNGVTHAPVLPEHRTCAQTSLVWTCLAEPPL